MTNGTVLLLVQYEPNEGKINLILHTHKLRECVKIDKCIDRSETALSEHIM